MRMRPGSITVKCPTQSGCLPILAARIAPPWLLVASANRNSTMPHDAGIQHAAPGGYLGGTIGVNDGCDRSISAGVLLRPDFLQCESLPCVEKAKR